MQLVLRLRIDILRPVRFLKTKKDWEAKGFKNEDMAQDVKVICQVLICLVKPSRTDKLGLNYGNFKNATTKTACTDLGSIVKKESGTGRGVKKKEKNC